MIAKEKIAFKVKFVLLDVSAGLGTFKNQSRQNLIASEPEVPEKEVEATTFTVQKEWVGDEGTGNRPSAITVTLYGQNGEIVNKDAAGKSITNPVTLTESNATSSNNNLWEYTFQNLPKKGSDGQTITYTVSESASISEDDQKKFEVYTSVGKSIENGYKFTNTLGTTRISVMKIWFDRCNRDGIRPDAVKVTLYEEQDDGTLIESKDENGTTRTMTLYSQRDKNEKQGITWGNNTHWYGAFKNLPNHKDGKVIKYVVKEEEKYLIKQGEEYVAKTNEEGYEYTLQDMGYNVEYDYSDPSYVRIVNRYIPEKIKIKVQKVWDDDNNRDGLRPSSISLRFNDGSYSLYLEKDEETCDCFDIITTNEIPTLEATTGETLRLWIRNGDGESRGQTTTEDKNGDGVVDENDGWRGWVDIDTWFDDEDGDSYVPQTVELNDKNNWTFTTEDLYKYWCNATDKQFKLEETGVPEGYTASPITQYFSTYQDGDGKKESGNVPEENGESNVTYDPETRTYTFTVINTHQPELIEIPVTKVWDDNSNSAGNRPESIKVKLYAKTADGGKVLVQEKTLTSANVDSNDPNKWTYTFTSNYEMDAKNRIYKYRDQGTEIEYIVEEEPIENYSTSIKQNKDTNGNIKVTITNSQGTTKIEVMKIWFDRSNRDGKRPDSVKIMLYEEQEDGTLIEAKDENGNHITMTLQSQRDKTVNQGITWGNNTHWYGAFKNLPTHRNGKEIKYVVKEDQNVTLNGTKTTLQELGYEDEYDYSNPTYIKVTNRYIPEKIKITVKKVWDDDNNRDGLRPSSINLRFNDGSYSFHVETEPETCDCFGTITRNEIPTEEATTGETLRLWIRNGDGESRGEQTENGSYEGWVDIDTWFDRENADSYVPQTVELNDDNNWTFTTEGLYKYWSNAIDKQFKLEETNLPDGYTASPITQYFSTYQDGDGKKESGNVPEGESNVTYDPETKTYTFTVTNTHQPELIEIPVVKEWIDNSNRDGTRPENIKITLYAETAEGKDVAIQEKILTQQNADPNDPNKWIYTFTSNYEMAEENRIYKYRDEGTLITYKIKEEIMGDSGSYKEPVIEPDSIQGNPERGVVETSGFTIINMLGDVDVVGTVWEDTDTNSFDSERLGNGKYDNGEKTVGNVKVQLYKIVTQQNGTVEEQLIEEIYTNNDGSYKFERIENGEYFIKYTYGNDSTEQGGNLTKIDGNEVNARNYKSTTINTIEDPIMKQIIGKETSLTDEEKMWPLTHNQDCTVAVDNMIDRLEIDELTYTTFDIGESITAYTKPFIVSNRRNAEYKLNFGIIERPREDLIVQKTISDFRITLANGQELTGGNPSENKDIKYAKVIGFSQSSTIDQARIASNAEKKLLVEMDTELIQGAQLDVKYEVKIINNNEIDYNYGEESDYAVNEHIAIGNKANYYYFGEVSGLEEMTSTIRFVDYIDKDHTYNISDESNSDWKQIAIEELIKEEHVGRVESTNEINRLISSNVEDKLTEEGYKILQASEEVVTVRRGIENAFIQEMTTSKLLANRDENAFDNHIEIIGIDGKTARTVKSNSIEYKPGNYEPTASSTEQDDDRVEIIITPPTGLVEYIITYAIVGLIGLVILFIGVTFIKKKVLIK